jgi:hypothetical protein
MNRFIANLSFRRQLGELRLERTAISHAPDQVNGGRSSSEWGFLLFFAYKQPPRCRHAEKMHAFIPGFEPDGELLHREMATVSMQLMLLCALIFALIFWP